LLLGIGLALGALAAASFARAESAIGGGFRLKSTTFANDRILPISTINNILL
jgi:hypothetical protein